MPSETIEITLIFFILFIISLSIVNLFLSLQENVFSSLNKLFLEIIKNKVFLAYIASSLFENSTVTLDLSSLQNTWIVGNPNGLTININTDATAIAVNNTKGIGYGVVYFYNKNNTIYIL